LPTSNADLAMTAKTIRTIAACVAAMLSFAAAARAEPYRHYRRASAYGESPVYWGVEHRVRTYRDCCGWRWTELNPGEASVRQLDPRLRARSDGRLLEEVGTPPPEPEVVVVYPDGSYAGSVIPPWGFRWFGARRGHHTPRPLNGAASRGPGASGSQRRAR
jgi:hypothetical protein